MRFFKLSIFLVFLIFSGCSSESGPVSIPVPFSGSLTADTRAVIADGTPTSNASGCLEFSVFNSDGSRAGISEICPSSAVVISPAPVGNRHQFNIPITVKIFNGDSENFPSQLDCNSPQVDCVSSEIECFEFLHEDPGLVPPPGVELRKGVCSGIIETGDGIFTEAPGRATADFRYVAFATLTNNQKDFLEMNEGVFLLRGAEDPASFLAGLSESRILTTMFENVVPPNEFIFSEVLNEAISPLFCEGDLVTACGVVVYRDTIFNTSFNSETGLLERVIIQTTATVCEGSSCVTTFNTIFESTAVPELGEGVFQTTMTQHDPVLCQHVTGKFAAPVGCDPTSTADDGNLANILLDYRCFTVFDPTGMFILEIRGGAYVIATPE